MTEQIKGCESAESGCEPLSAGYVWHGFRHGHCHQGPVVRAKAVAQYQLATSLQLCPGSQRCARGLASAAQRVRHVHRASAGWPQGADSQPVQRDGENTSVRYSAGVSASDPMGSQAGSTIGGSSKAARSEAGR